MQRLRILVILILLSLMPLYSLAVLNEGQYAFRSLDINNGLSQNTVHAILQDKQGFMWFGTDDGLSRYDGKTIQNFKPADTYASVAAIVRLSDDFLGIVFDGYLYYFNRKQETFLPIHTESDTAIGVFNVLPADDSSFWGISGNRLILCQWEIRQGKEEEKTAVRVPRAA